ncbi:MAG: hypothetical protein H6Q66_2100 [Firmicutes bacterium]|nr:hypothetical protein [Bacillota bacterium]
MPAGDYLGCQGKHAENPSPVEKEQTLTRESERLLKSVCEASYLISLLVNDNLGGRFGGTIKN